MDNPKESIRTLLEYMKDHRASDLHITVGIRPYIRVDGRIMAAPLDIFSEDECEKMLFSILTEPQIEKFRQTKVVDCSYGEKSLGRFRFNIYMQRGTIAAAIRRLPIKIFSFEELGLPVDVLKKLCKMSQGLIIIAGPVGSGKTTTLASIIQYINQTRNCHIISIEEPIEYLHQSDQSLIHQREIGTDAISFSEALRQGLREDPDVVMIGEMRDLETVSTAVTIAETGHLVLATLHTPDASESISRIVDVFPSMQQAQVRVQLSSSIEAVINQMLLPQSLKNGMVVATEILMATPAVRSLIRDNKIDQIYSQIQLGGQYHMHTMNQSLHLIINEGKVDREIALTLSSRPKELEKLLAGE
ncbi:type IV pilus twitching motility protein PilT [Elusimicrobiota bacterium]